MFEPHHILACIVVALLILIGYLSQYFCEGEPNILIINSNVWGEVDQDIKSDLAQVSIVPDATDATQKYIIYHNGAVQALSHIVLRNLPNYGPVWHVARLEIDLSYRGQQLPYRMFCKVFLPACFHSDKSYVVAPIRAAGDLERYARVASTCGFDLSAVYDMYSDGTVVNLSHPPARIPDPSGITAKYAIFQYNMHDYPWDTASLTELW